MCKGDNTTRSGNEWENFTTTHKLKWNLCLSYISLHGCKTTQTMLDLYGLSFVQVSIIWVSVLKLYFPVLYVLIAGWV